MKSLIGLFVVITVLALAACDKHAFVVVDTKDATVVTPVPACCADDASAPVEAVDAGGTVVEPKLLVAPTSAPLTVDPPKTVSTSPVAAAPVAPAATIKK
jgi:hypothetical protein